MAWVLVKRVEVVPPSAQALTAGEISFAAPLRRRDGEEAPFAGHALEFVSATLLELES
jgi:hypothetical protein